VLVQVKQRLGDLDLSEHVAYSPSPLISGVESAEHVMKMPAETAMIVKGDLASQLFGQANDRVVERLEPYVDDHGRARMRVVFADTGEDSPSMDETPKAPNMLSAIFRWIRSARR